MLYSLMSFVMNTILLYNNTVDILFLPLSLIDFYYFIGRNVMGDLLCEDYRDELNTCPSTPGGNSLK